MLLEHVEKALDRSGYFLLGIWFRVLFWCTHIAQRTVAKFLRVATGMLHKLISCQVATTVAKPFRVSINGGTSKLDGLQKNTLCKWIIYKWKPPSGLRQKWSSSIWPARGKQCLHSDIRSCKHVRRLTDWQKDGWFFSADGRAPAVI